MGKLIFITNNDRRYGMLSQCMNALHESNQLQTETSCHLIKKDTTWSDEWKQILTDGDAVVLHWMGRSVDYDFLKKCSTFLKNRDIPYFMETEGNAREKEAHRVSEEIIATVWDYTNGNGKKNLSNMILYVAHHLCGEETTFEPAKPLPWCGIYRPELPDTYTDDPEAYRAQYIHNDRPTVGVLFYREEWIWGDTQYQAALIQEIEKQGMNVICLFSDGSPSEKQGHPSFWKVFDTFFRKDGHTVIDVLINAMKFSFTAAEKLTIHQLKELDIPILQSYTLLKSYEDWLRSLSGLSDIEVSISISMPEFDGAIHGVPISAKKILDDGTVVHTPIPERLHRMVEKAKKWALLHHKPNKDKKIALLFHNFPPKNSNIGSAFGMDSLESARRLLQDMGKEGYTVSPIPDDRNDFLRELTANATNDVELLSDEQAEKAMHVSTEEYQSFEKTFPEKAQKELTERWGEAPGSVMLNDDEDIIIPGTLYGNVFVSVQPSRSYDVDAEKMYHDPYIPPTHQYEAFYYWLRDVWKADAVIHFGTHGTLEWLPGKSTALGAEDYPDLSLGDLPNIYPYHMTIAGEGMQAKRRSSACLIGYLPAPTADAGLYDDLAELEKVLDDYSDLQNNPAQQEVLEAQIRERAQKASLDEEIPYDEKAPFADYISALHNYLEELKSTEIHTGLHILGQPPEGEQLTNFMLQMLRLPNGNLPSIYDLFAEKYGITSDEAQRQANDICEKTGETYARTMTHVRQECEAFVKLLQEKDFTKEAQKEALASDIVTNGDSGWQEKVATLATYICETILPALLRTKDEEGNILAALSGRYVEPGPSGSPAAGGVSLLPSGRNFFGVDPRMLPTPAAWEIGKKLGDRLIETFIADEGHYPENVGMIFWSGTNIRTRGQDIAECFYLLGVKPVWQTGSMTMSGLEVIPLNELKRPRIDVTARISGLFRDTLSALSEWVDAAILLVADLDENEEDNYIRKHIQEDAKELEASGIGKEEAWRHAAYRVFGDAPGTYGTGINHALDDRNWSNTDDLANIFIRWGGHAFGGKEKGTFMPDAFKKRLATMDVTVKNNDNHDINVLSIDDFNGFQGGLIAAVRSVSGKTPKAYFSDTTNVSRPAIRTVQEEIKKVFRTESMNPKFIKGMMEHGYKGASDMADMLNFTYQWDATTGFIDDWMYEEYAEKYTLDPEVQKWMKHVNPWALKQMAEKLLEAEQRQLWNAKPETKEKLRQLYLEAEGDIEDDGEDD